jgi:hypothetical protein
LHAVLKDELWRWVHIQVLRGPARLLLSSKWKNLGSVENGCEKICWKPWEMLLRVCKPVGVDCGMFNYNCVQWSGNSCFYFFTCNISPNTCFVTWWKCEVNFEELMCISVFFCH